MSNEFIHGTVRDIQRARQTKQQRKTRESQLNVLLTSWLTPVSLLMRLGFIFSKHWVTSPTTGEPEMWDQCDQRWWRTVCGLRMLPTAQTRRKFLVHMVHHWDAAHELYQCQSKPVRGGYWMPEGACCESLLNFDDTNVVIAKVSGRASELEAIRCLSWTRADFPSYSILPTL